MRKLKVESGQGPGVSQIYLQKIQSILQFDVLNITLSPLLQQALGMSTQVRPPAATAALTAPFAEAASHFSDPPESTSMYENKNLFNFFSNPQASMQQKDFCSPQPHCATLTSDTPLSDDKPSRSRSGLGFKAAYPTEY